MRLDIGVVSYGSNVGNLRRTLETIAQHTESDWRCFVVHNPSPGDERTREAICAAANRDPRFIPVWMESNVGYVGGVNKLCNLADANYVAYCDNDIEIHTPGWDTKLLEVLNHPEVGQVFPGHGHYGFHNGRYSECLWNAGYCWIVKTQALQKLILSDAEHKRCLSHWPDQWPMDATLGHHEEVDLMIRLRLAGFQIGCRPDVNVTHHETATNANAADHQPGGRIHDGVVRWMNKWNRYFCGEQLEYSMTKYDDRALRYTDWPPCALYLERMTLHRFPNWNGDPRAVRVPGVGNMDAVEVLKPTGCYKGRAI